MANCCSTTIGIMAQSVDEEALRQLEDLQVQSERICNEGGIRGAWFGLIPQAYGVDMSNIRCRSTLISVSEIKGKDDFRYFLIDTEDAWNPYEEAVDALLSAPALDRLSYVMVAVEESNNVCINTDAEGKLFPQRYLLDYDGTVLDPNGDTDGYIFYDTFGALVKDTKRLFGVSAKSFDELYRMLSDYEDENDVFISVHKFEA